MNKEIFLYIFPMIVLFILIALGVALNIVEEANSHHHIQQYESVILDREAKAINK